VCGAGRYIASIGKSCPCRHEGASPDWPRRCAARGAVRLARSAPEGDSLQRLELRFTPMSGRPRIWDTIRCNIASRYFLCTKKPVFHQPLASISGIPPVHEMLTGPIGLYPGGVTNVLGNGVLTQMPPMRNPAIGGSTLAGPLSLIRQMFPRELG